MSQSRDRTLLLDQQEASVRYRRAGATRRDRQLALGLAARLRGLSYLGRVTIDETIKRAASVLAQEARGPARVILFGSHARGDERPGSDIDFLVVQRDVRSSFDESVRLRSKLRGLGVPIDVIVVSEQEAEDWREVTNAMLCSALNEGKVLADTR